MTNEKTFIEDLLKLYKLAPEHFDVRTYDEEGEYCPGRTFLRVTRNGYFEEIYEAIDSKLDSIKHWRVICGHTQALDMTLGACFEICREKEWSLCSTYRSRLQEIENSCLCELWAGLVPAISFSAPVMAWAAVHAVVKALEAN